MSVKLLTEHHLASLSLKGAAEARLSLRLSKCHIVGNHMSRLNYSFTFIVSLSNNMFNTIFFLNKLKRPSSVI